MRSYRLTGASLAVLSALALGACATTGSTAGDSSSGAAAPKPREALAPGLDVAANPDPYPSTYAALPRENMAIVGATVLTGKVHSAILPPSLEQLHLLRSKHGADLENWWLSRFGHTFDCLTQSEARYLERTADANTIRNRVIAAEQAGNCGASENVS